MTHDEFTAALAALTDDQAKALADKLIHWREHAKVDAESIRVEGDTVAWLARWYLKSCWRMSSNADRSDIERELEAVRRVK